MGIRNLTRFINVNSKNGIQKMVLLKLKGKTIVIDTSIYLYKFASNDSLIEDMYSLCSLLLFYKITPIFIFDGFRFKQKCWEKSKVHKLSLHQQKSHGVHVNQHFLTLSETRSKFGFRKVFKIQKSKIS